MPVNKLNLVSTIPTIRRIEPSITPGSRVHPLPAPERGRGSGETYHFDIPRVDADTSSQLRRVSSTVLLDSMIRQMGGATIPSAKGSYVDIVV